MFMQILKITRNNKNENFLGQMLCWNFKNLKFEISPNCKWWTNVATTVKTQCCDCCQNAAESHHQISNFDHFQIYICETFATNSRNSEIYFLQVERARVGNSYTKFKILASYSLGISCYSDWGSQSWDLIIHFWNIHIQLNESCKSELWILRSPSPMICVLVIRRDLHLLNFVFFATLGVRAETSWAYYGKTPRIPIPYPSACKMYSHLTFSIHFTHWNNHFGGNTVVATAEINDEGANTTVCANLSAGFSYGMNHPSMTSLHCNCKGDISFHRKYKTDAANTPKAKRPKPTPQTRPTQNDRNRRRQDAAKTPNAKRPKMKPTDDHGGRKETARCPEGWRIQCGT